MNEELGSIIKVIENYPFNGSICVYSGYHRNENNKKLFKIATDLVDAGEADLELVNGDCYILKLKRSTNKGK